MTIKYISNISAGSIIVGDVNISAGAVVDVATITFGTDYGDAIYRGLLEGTLELLTVSSVVLTMTELEYDELYILTRGAGDAELEDVSSIADLISTEIQPTIAELETVAENPGLVTTNLVYNGNLMTRNRLNQPHGVYCVGDNIGDATQYSDGYKNAIEVSPSNTSLDATSSIEPMHKIQVADELYLITHFDPDTLVDNQSIIDSLQSSVTGVLTVWYNINTGWNIKIGGFGTVLELGGLEHLITGINKVVVARVSGGGVSLTVNDNLVGETAAYGTYLQLDMFFGSVKPYTGKLYSLDVYSGGTNVTGVKVLGVGAPSAVDISGNSMMLSDAPDPTIGGSAGGSLIMPDTTFNFTAGHTLATPINLGVGGEVITFNVFITQWDSHWGCLLSGEFFRLSHEGTIDTRGRLNFEYSVTEGWRNFKELDTLVLSLNTLHEITFQIDLSNQVCNITLDGLLATAPMSHGTPKTTILTTVAKNAYTTSNGSINYVYGTISNLTSDGSTPAITVTPRYTLESFGLDNFNMLTTDPFWLSSNPRVDITFRSNDGSVDRWLFGDDTSTLAVKVLAGTDGDFVFYSNGLSFTYTHTSSIHDGEWKQFTLKVGGSGNIRLVVDGVTAPQTNLVYGYSGEVSIILGGVHANGLDRGNFEYKKVKIIDGSTVILMWELDDNSNIIKNAVGLVDVDLYGTGTESLIGNATITSNVITFISQLDVGSGIIVLSDQMYGQVGVCTVGDSFLVEITYVSGDLNALGITDSTNPTDFNTNFTPWNNVRDVDGAVIPNLFQAVVHDCQSTDVWFKQIDSEFAVSFTVNYIKKVTHYSELKAGGKWNHHTNAILYNGTLSQSAVGWQAMQVTPGDMYSITLGMQGITSVNIPVVIMSEYSGLHLPAGCTHLTSAAIQSPTEDIVKGDSFTELVVDDTTDVYSVSTVEYTVPAGVYWCSANLKNAGSDKIKLTAINCISGGTGEVLPDDGNDDDDGDDVTDPPVTGGSFQSNPEGTTKAYRFLGKISKGSDGNARAFIHTNLSVDPTTLAGTNTTYAVLARATNSMHTGNFSNATIDTTSSPGVCILKMGNTVASKLNWGDNNWYGIYTTGNGNLIIS